MKRALVWIALFFGIASTLLAAEPAAFREGNDLYKKGEYDSALEKYVSVLSSNLESSALYFNIGNCFFKKGEWGRAIVNYERASRLAPRDPDIAFNERLALSKIPTLAIAPSAALTDRLSRFIFRRVTVNEATISLVLIYLLGLVLLAVAAFWSRKQSLRWRVAGIFTLLIFLFGIVLLYDKINDLDREGIIVTKTIAAKFEPTPEATTYFDLSEGMKVKTLEDNNGWLKIRRSDAKTGWIPKNTLEII